MAGDASATRHRSRIILPQPVSYPPSYSVHSFRAISQGDMQVGVNTTFVGVDRRARLMGKSLTISALVLLLSLLYLLLIGMLAPRFGVTGTPIGHMLATVLIAILVVPLRNRL